MLGLLLGFMPRVKQHERWLLDRIATHILAFEDDGLLARAQTRILPPASSLSRTTAPRRARAHAAKHAASEINPRSAGCAGLGYVSQCL